MAERPRKAFVCGHPIGHSRSPLIHRYWLRQFGISGSYDAVDVAPDAFPQFLDRLGISGFVGGNVTIPHKETANSLVSRRDEAAELIGAVNTLWLEEGTLHGGNTDAYGFAANLDICAPGWHQARRVVVLGAGGASRAVVFALRHRGIADIRIVNRTVARATTLSHRFGGGVSAHGLAALAELLEDADMLVNTTPPGRNGQETMATDLTRMPDAALVTDIVYVPVQTPLLAGAAARGLKTVDGIGMLLHQAVPGFERWFGVRPKVTGELREILVSDVERRS
jgi:shikimate dehydrogenase